MLNLNLTHLIDDAKCYETVRQMIYTYGIYNALPHWGYEHKTVCHGAGEYARDDDEDGFCEVHVNTIEGFWSLLRSQPLTLLP